MDPVERYARAALAAYRDIGPIRPMLADIGFDLLSECDRQDTDIHGYAAFDGKVLVIGFEGTKDWENALRDALVKLVTFFPDRVPRATLADLILAGKQLLVHSGFRDGWLSARDWAHAIIKATYEAQCIVFTGHSMGGALATDGALDTATGLPVLAYTYGSPRVGNQGFARAYDGAGLTTVRVVHDEDVVPRVPWGSYQHVGGELRLADDGKVIGPIRSWWRRLFNDLDLGALRDHSASRYVTTCARYAARQAALQGAAQT